MNKEEQYIQEDFERMWHLDSMYIMEKQMEEEHQYYEWEQEQERRKLLPARIEIIKETRKEYSKQGDSLSHI